MQPSYFFYGFVSVNFINFNESNILCLFVFSPLKPVLHIYKKMVEVHIIRFLKLLINPALQTNGLVKTFVPDISCVKKDLTGRIKSHLVARVRTSINGDHWDSPPNIPQFQYTIRITGNNCITL